MNIQHGDLAAGRWRNMTFLEQMASIDSEVERALNWKAKNNMEYSLKAAERALELLDLSLDTIRTYPKLKEIARMREVLVDFFWCSNSYLSSEISLRKYFSAFSFAARKGF